MKVKTRNQTDTMLGDYSNVNAILKNADWDNDGVDVSKVDTKIIPEKGKLTRNTIKSDDRGTA